MLLYIAISVAFAGDVLAHGQVEQAISIIELSGLSVFASLILAFAIAVETGAGRLFVLLVSLAFLGVAFGLSFGVSFAVEGVHLPGWLWTIIGSGIGLVYAPAFLLRLGLRQADKPASPSGSSAVSTDPLDERDPAALARARQMLKKRPLAAIGELRALADQSSVGAMLELGHAYEAGDGVDVDIAESEAWYRRAAESESVRAQLDLGRLLRRLTRYDDAKLAFEYAAARGDALAEAELGLLSLRGFGCEKDRDKARRHFERASERGSLWARHVLARLAYEDAQSFPCKVWYYFVNIWTAFGMLKAMALQDLERE